jgi:hypothetical protein
MLILAVHCSRLVFYDLELCVNFPITGWLDSICKYVPVTKHASSGKILSGGILADRHLAVAGLNS